MFQSGIGTVAGQQLFTGTLFHDVLCIYHRNAVGVADRGEAVGNHHDGFPLAETVDASLDPLLGDTVQRRSRFIQNQDRRILQKHTRDGDALFLTAGEHDAAFPDEALIPVRHVQDVLVDFGADCGLNEYSP